MYLSEKPRPVDFYKPVELITQQQQIDHHQQQQQQQSSMFMGESSGGEEQEVLKTGGAAPKKRAETWAQEETRCLIGLRREIDGMFNLSKSNKHLWEQISARMRDRGFDRSPTMCTDKWRNLLKEFKKARGKSGGSCSGVAKMSYYKELDELLRERGKNVSYRSPSTSAAAIPAKVDSYLQFSDKGLEDADIPFESVEGSGRPALNLESQLDHDGGTLAITAAADTVVPNGVPPWNWKDASVTGGDNHVPYGGRVILVKWGEYTKKVGIDGSAEAIKDSIKSAFRLRTKRAFWLEDEEEVVRALDRDMPLGPYILHLDEGVTIKVVYEGTDSMPVHTEEKTFYTEEDFHKFLTRRGWISLRELSGFRSVDGLEDLRPGSMYQGVRLLGD